MAGFVGDHVFESYGEAFFAEGIGFLGALGVIGDGLFFGGEDGFDHFLVGGGRGHGASLGGGFPAEGDNFIGEELGVGQFVGDFGEEELGELGPVGTVGLGGVDGVLGDGGEFAGEVFVEMIDQCLFVHSFNDTKD